MRLLFVLIISVIFAFPTLGQTVSEKFESAMTAYHSDQFAQANGLFEEFFREYKLTDEMYATAKYYSADALLKLGRKNEAAIGFEYLVSNFYWSNFRSKSLYNLGLIYFNSKDYKNCRSSLKLLLEDYPQSEFTGTALYWIGESYSEENNLEEAILFLEDAVAGNKNNKYVDYSIYTLANVYEKMGDYESAVTNYDKLLTFHRDSPLAVSAQIRIGICYFKLKDYQSSILELNNPIISSLPEELYSEGLYLLANSYYRVQEFGNAEKSYKEILKNFPKSKIIRDAEYGLAWSHFQLKEYDDAFLIFDKLSSKHDSLGIKSFYWKAECKRYAGNDNQAFEIYRDFLQTFPNSELVEDVQLQMGVIYYNSKNLDMASRFLITSSSARDKSVKARSLTLLGEIELSKKLYANSLNYFEPVLRITNADKELHNRALLGLGIAMFNLGQHREAIERLTELELLDSKFETQKVNFYLAENHFSSNQYKEAVKRYNSSVGSDDAINVLAQYGKAYSYFNSGDYENAAMNFSDFLKKYPRNSRASDSRFRLADSYYGAKNYTMASNVYRDIFKSGNAADNNPYANYQFAQALFKSGKVKEAIDEFNKVQSKFPNSEYAEASLFTIGWIFFQQSNFYEAIDRYKQVLVKYSNSRLQPTVHYSIGDSYFNLGKYDSAIVYYEKVLTESKSSNYVFDAVNGIQFSYVAMGAPERAISFIDQFVSRNPNFKEADQLFFKKGEIYYSLRQYENAKLSYKEFIAAYPKSSLASDAYYWIGKSAQNLQQNEEAVFNFEKIVRDYKSSEIAAASVLEIGNIHRTMGSYDKAVKIYDQGINDLKKSARIPELLFNKGNTLVQMNKFQEAYEVFDEVAMYYPTTIFADKSKFEMGLIQLSIGRFENANNLFLSLAEKRSDDLGAQAQYHYGLSLFEQGRTTDAITALVRVRTVFSNYDEWLTKSYILLGDSYVKIKDFEKAKEMYRAVVQKHKGNAFGQEAQDKLRKLK